MDVSCCKMPSLAGAFSLPSASLCFIPKFRRNQERSEAETVHPPSHRYSFHEENYLNIHEQFLLFVLPTLLAQLIFANTKQNEPPQCDIQKARAL